MNLVGDILPKVKIHRPDYSYIGVNNLSVFTAFDESDVTYLEGNDNTIWESEAPVCVMRNKFLDQHGLKPGDTIELDIFSSEYDSNGFLSWVFQPLGVHKFKIVGSYNPGTTMITDDLPDIIGPIKTLSQIHKKADVPYFASSYSFQVQNPLLLNEFKDRMALLDFTPVNPQAEGSRVGNTLIINDETFIRSATQITKSLTLLQLLCPLFFVLVAIISFVLSFLLMQGRKKDLAIMRSLGTRPRKVFVILLLESLIPLLPGIVCGTVVFLLVMGRQPFSAVQQALLTITFAVFYLVGIILAISLINRNNVMALLSKLD